MKVFDKLFFVVLTIVALFVFFSGFFTLQETSVGYWSNESALGLIMFYFIFVLLDLHRIKEDNDNVNLLLKELEELLKYVDEKKVLKAFKEERRKHGKI